MMFILRAAFWIAVVAAFVPPGFTAAGGLFASDMERLLAEPAARAAQSLNAQQSTPAAAASQHNSGVCADYGELCEIWDHVTGFGGYVGTVALSQADAMIEASRETGTDKAAAQTR